MMSDEDKLYKIYMSLRAGLARAVMGIVPPKEVEDIVQETYVRLCQIENKDRLITPSFLYKIAQNLALDHVRSAESRLTETMDEDNVKNFEEVKHSTNDTFEKVATSAEFAYFCKAVRRLPVQSRRAFVLKKVYGYSQSEIARMMNLSENTVEKHIAQGFKRCLYYMQQYSEGEYRQPSKAKETVNE